MQPERGEWDREEAPGRGTDLNSRSHRRCTSSKAKIEEKSPKKPIKGTGRGENSTARWFWTTWDIVYTCALVSAHVEDVKWNTNTYPPASVWVDVWVWDTRGEIIPLPGTGSSLIKLALVFNQLCLQKWEHRSPSFPWLLWNQKCAKGLVTFSGVWTAGVQWNIMWFL